MWRYDNCDKDVQEPAIELIRDTTDYQGREVSTGFVDEVEVCPDCGLPVRSTAQAVFILDDALDEIPI